MNISQTTFFAEFSDKEHNLSEDTTEINSEQCDVKLRRGAYY